MTTPKAVYNRWVGDPSGDMYEFIQFLRHRAKGNILEIGVRDGVSTASFLLGLEKNGGHLWSLDIDAKCGELFNHPQWTFIHSDSTKEDLERDKQIITPLDILFIDGDHTHPAVDHDLNHWSKLVRKGGMILVHDIVPPPNVTPKMIAEGWGTEDVRDAYHAFIIKTGATHFELPGKFGMGVIYV